MEIILSAIDIYVLRNYFLYICESMYSAVVHCKKMQQRCEASPSTRVGGESVEVKCFVLVCDTIVV
jgi:hypothetical protein